MPRLWQRAGNDVIATAGLLAITLILWLPFGLAVPFWADAWGVMGLTDQGAVVQNTIRPFVNVPYAIAQLLSPNLFADLNFVLVVLFFGKAFFLYLLLKRLGKSRALAFAAAALVLIIPADTAIFNDGTFSIHFALCAYVAAIYCLIAYWQDRRWYFLILMGVALALTTGIYETVYPLLLFTPVLLVWQEGRISRRVIQVASFWYMVPFIMVIRLIAMARQNPGEIAYQSNLFAGISLSDLTPTFLNVYRIHFVDGWLRTQGTAYPTYVIAAALIGGLLCWWLLHHQPKLDWRTLLLFVVGGLVVIALGYAPYFPTTLRPATARTFFYSSLGAAVTGAALFLILAQLLPAKSFIYAVLIGVLVGLGMIQLLDQHHLYEQLGQNEVQLLRQITTQVPLIQPNSAIMVIDNSADHKVKSAFVSASYYFENILRVIYHDSTLGGVICSSHDETPSGIFEEQCDLKADRVILTFHGIVHLQQVYSRVVAFRLQPDGRLKLITSLAPDVADAQGYNPYLLIDQSAPFSQRMSAMLWGNQ